MRCLPILFSLLLAASSASANFTLGRSVVGAAGGFAASGALTLQATWGESIVGPVTGTDAGTLGFWTYAAGVTSVAPTPDGLAHSHILTIAPNPVRSIALVRYAIAPRDAGKVSLQIYDIRGRLLATLEDERVVHQAGMHATAWNADAATAVPSGMYLLRFHVGNTTETARFVVCR